MYEIENFFEIQQELNIWEMEEAFAEANTQYFNECDNVVVASFGGSQ